MVPYSPVGYPEKMVNRTGSVRTTLLVISTVAALAARGAAGASGEVAGVGTVGRVVRTPAVSRGRLGSTPGRRHVLPSSLLRVQAIPEVTLGHLPAEDVHQAHGDRVVGDLVPMDRIFAPARVEGVHELAHGAVVGASL